MANLRIAALVISALLSVISFDASAANWNPFAPKDFDDCILKNMKGTTSDTAAKWVAATCRKQFPTKEDIQEKETKEAIKACGFDPYKNYRFTIFDVPRVRATTDILNNIKITRLWKEENYRDPMVENLRISVQNKNNIYIDQIEIGFTDSKSSCPSTTDGYKYSSTCIFSVVDPGKVGSGQCDVVPKSYSNLRYCKVSYVPWFSSSELGAFLQFIRENKYCKN